MSAPSKPISCTDEAAKSFVNRFCDQVHWLKSVRYVYKVLFEDEQPSCQTLMERTAPSFFADLNRILQEYLLLECAKITDSAATRNHENFTVEFLVQNICWPNDKEMKLESLKVITDSFRSFIESARNKLLAHLDKETVLSGKLLGEFPKGRDRAFFDALEELCNIAHEACFGTIYGDMITSGRGDVFGLIKSLRQGIAFDAALSESSGQNKTWLLSYLQNARHEPKS